MLLVIGAHSADSVGSSISRLFTGEPTESAMWKLVAGVASSAVGLGLMSGREVWNRLENSFLGVFVEEADFFEVEEEFEFLIDLGFALGLDASDQGVFAGVQI